MIVDAQTLADGAIACDVCIVGGGAAGISLAVELANTSANVCLLESGGLRHERAAQALLRGKLVGSPYPDLHETRLAALGGSTALWAGWCRPLDPIDFEARDWIPDSGWPFAADELLPFYARAHEICALGPPDYDPERWATRTGCRPLPLEVADFEPRMVHVNPLNFGAHYRPALERMRNVTTVLHATALRVDADRDGNRIEHVRAVTAAKRDFTVSAPLVVLAAGGIENARLLLLSGDSPEQSIGNAHGLVGRYFMEHGFVNAGTYYVGDAPQSLAFHFPKRIRLEGRDCTVRAVLAPSPRLIRSERLLNGAVFFHPAYEAHPAFDAYEVKAMLEIWDKLRGRAVPGGYAHRAAHVLRAPAHVARALARKVLVREGPTRYWRTRTIFECVPQPGNRVTLSPERDAFGRPRARVHWRPADVDLSSAKRLHALLDRALRRAGLGRFQSRLADDEEWRAALDCGKHHMGTTRMHADPNRGVVDPDCRVHGIDNLYVAGSSVFPTGGFANPTLTIVALAVRLAAHLRGRLRNDAGR